MYSLAEIAANFGNKVSNGILPTSFNALRKKCEKGNLKDLASYLGDLQWYRKIRELRTEWAHYSAIFIGEDKDQTILCIRSFRRECDKVEFSEEMTFCTVMDIQDWTKSALTTLDCFAGYVLSHYVLPTLDLDFNSTVPSPIRDEFGFPKQYEDGKVMMDRISIREFLRRGGVVV
jgi:hypothetical protein